MTDLTTRSFNNTPLSENELIAAIDIGSNSFHLAIARVDHGEVRKVASMSEKVQLAAGLDENNLLSNDAQQRGLDCLNRFMGRLDAVSSNRLRIVATNALRQAKNSEDFINKANQILPKPIEIIAGREEARLIYLGVSHTNASSEKRLVIDIGGGSTEFIIGQQFEPILTESLQMGCVTYTKLFFNNGKITEKSFLKTMAATRKQIVGISGSYQKSGWSSVIGSSGTMKAVRNVLVSKGWSDDQERITYSGIKKLQKLLVELGDVDSIQLEGIKEHRKAVFPSGVGILRAVMKALSIDTIEYSDGALREGVMYDMLGRFASEDVRDRSVQALIKRYSVDKSQSNRVVETSQQLFCQVNDILELNNEDSDLLRRSAYLHEVGLAISHSGYHKHSAYLLEHSDVPGFSQIEQSRMSKLLYNHRKKLKTDVHAQVYNIGGESLVSLCLILRLSVLLNHGRSDFTCNPIKLSIIDNNHWKVEVTSSLDDKLLMLSDLTEEISQFAKWGITLTVD